MPASDNTAMTLGASEARTITAKIVRLLEKKCIHLNGRDPAWRRLFTQRSQDLESSTSALDFERTVNELLTEGGLSHVAFFHETGNQAPARYAINATFTRLESDNGIGPRWIFQDVHEGGPAYNAGIRPGDILVTVKGEVVAPPALPTFALGTDAAVTVRRAGEATDTPLTIVLPKAPANGKSNAKPPMAEPTSVTARLLDEEVGYLRVAFFPGVNGQRFARDLDAALAAVAGCTRLIVDLRGNLGGFVGSLRLMSHLTPERVPIGYSLTRKGEDRGWKPDQLACIDRLPTSKFDMLKMAFRFLVWHRDRSIRLMTEGLGSKAVSREGRGPHQRTHAECRRDGRRLHRGEPIGHASGYADGWSSARRREFHRRPWVRPPLAGRRLVHVARRRGRGRGSATGR